MERWVALVRNVMIGREGLHRAVLLEHAQAVGAEEPRSYLATGNLTFGAAAGDIEDLAEGLEDRIAEVLGRRELVAVRSRTWFRELVARDPFRDHPATEWALEIAFLSAAAPASQGGLGDTGSTVVVEVGPRELLTARPVSGPRGPHAGPLLERLAGAPATARAWSTVCRLAEDRQAPD